MNQNSLKTRVNNQTERLLKDVAEEEGFYDYEIENAPGSMKGDGYMGVITAVRIIGKNKSQEKKELRLIVKSASKSDALRNETPVASVFEREIYMYNIVIPSFRKFTSEKGLPPFSSSAKCYKACLIDNNETLILENLKDKGYSVWERRIPMEDDLVSFVMAEYGRFHALSFAIRDQKPGLFHKLAEPMDDIFQTFMRNNFLKMFSNQCLKALKSLDAVSDEKAIRVFKRFIDEELSPFFERLCELVDEYSAILHGDCWTNNMMFKYEDVEEPTKPTKMCLIDLQIGRIGSPVLDLSYFLYSCASKKVINNFEHYMDLYYDSFCTYLSKLGSNPEKLYPKSIFHQQWKRCAKFGLICSMLLIHIMLSDQNEVTDFTDVADSGKSVIDAFDYNIANVDEYNDRVRHNENELTKPTKMCLIDLQVARLGPPVLDLSYFLYSCASKKVINNFEHYMDLYYHSFCMYLHKLGSNPEKLYPKSIFHQQWKQCSKFGLISSMLLIHVMLSDQNEVTDLADVAESGKSIIDAFDYNITNVEEYNDRVRHIILHFVNNNFI